MPIVYVRVDLKRILTKRDVRTKLCTHADAVGRKFCPECGLPEGRRETVLPRVELVNGIVVEPPFVGETLADFLAWAKEGMGTARICGLPVMCLEQHTLADVVQRYVVLHSKSEAPSGKFGEELPTSFADVSVLAQEILDALGQINVTGDEVFVR